MSEFEAPLLTEVSFALSASRDLWRPPRLRSDLLDERSPRWFVAAFGGDVGKDATISVPVLTWPRSRGLGLWPSSRHRHALCGVSSAAGVRWQVSAPPPRNLQRCSTGPKIDASCQALLHIRFFALSEREQSQIFCAYMCKNASQNGDNL